MDDLKREYEERLENEGLRQWDLEPDPELIESQVARARAWAAGHDVMVPDWVLADVRKMANQRWRGFQDVISGLSKSIEDTLATAGVELPLSVFAGEFPTHSYNAETDSARGGAIILVNTGLMLLIRQACEILAMGFQFERLPDGVFSECTFVDSHQRTLRIETLARIAVDYVDGYYGDLAIVPFDLGPRGSLGVALTSACQKFVLAHEYAHVWKGHVTDHANDDGDGQTLNWKRECEADIGAARLLLREAFELPVCPENMSAIGAAAAAPFLVFGLGDLLDFVARYRKANGIGAEAWLPGGSTPTHPSWRARGAVHERLLRTSDVGKLVLEHDHEWTHWFWQISADVVSATHDMPARHTLQGA